MASGNMAQLSVPGHGCPVLPGYDPLSPAELRDPYPSFARAQREAPVFYDARHGFWSVTRHADVLVILRDTQRFSSRMAIPMPLPPEDLRDRMPVYPQRPRTALHGQPRARSGAEDGAGALHAQAPAPDDADDPRARRGSSCARTIPTADSSSCAGTRRRSPSS